MAKNRQFSREKNPIILIFGYHSVRAALNNPSRRAKKLILTKNQYDAIGDQYLAKVEEVKIITKSEFNRIYNKEENNQGIALEAYNLETKSLNFLLNETKNKKSSIIIMLDQIQDPQNIGSIIRSASLFNCNTIITSKDHSPDLSSSIIKSASGGVEIINYLKETNLVRCINEIKKYGFWVVGLDSGANDTINKFKMPKKCLLVVGSEHSGIRKLIKENCDHLISIQTKVNKNFQIDSLNVSNATSIALYEHFNLFKFQK